jgi:hypothetical protein
MPGIEVDVAVDAAGEDQEARRINLRGGARQIGCEGGDAAVLDADVAFADVGSRDGGSAPNDEIKFHCVVSDAWGARTQDSCKAAPAGRGR